MDLMDIQKFQRPNLFFFELSECKVKLDFLEKKPNYGSCWVLFGTLCNKILNKKKTIFFGARSPSKLLSYKIESLRF